MRITNVTHSFSTAEYEVEVICENCNKGHLQRLKMTSTRPNDSITRFCPICKDLFRINVNTIFEAPKIEVDIESV